MARWLGGGRIISVWRRLRAWWHADRLDRDLRDEMAFHLAMRAAQMRDAGIDDAERRARHRFGNPARLREDLRAEWTVAPRLALLVQDLRYAMRTLRRNPGFAAVVVLTLAFGIGINTATFSIVNSVLLRPLAVPDADRLVAVRETLNGFLDDGPFSPPDYLDVAAEQQSFSAIGAYANQPIELSGGGEPVRLSATQVTASVFAALGVAPVTGRTITPDEERPGIDVTVLSWPLWQTRFEGDPAIIGRAITLDRKPYTVIGVMPEGFEFPWRGLRYNGTPADLWLPLAFTDAQREGRGNQFNYSAIARLNPGVTLAAAQAELAVLTSRVNARYPKVLGDRGFSIAVSAAPLREEIAGRLARPLLLLLAAVGLVLLVTCANVANLLLSRAAARGREIAVRTALGSSRARLWQLLLAEALVLSTMGGLLGVALSRVIVAAVPATVAERLPGSGVPLDLSVLAFCTALSLLTSAVFALVPMLTMERRTPGPMLQEEAVRTTPGVRRHRIQAALVVSTVALACVLLVGAGLFARSFAALMATDTGFNPDRTLAASLMLPPSGYDSAARVRGFHSALLAQAESLPGVRSAAVATDLALERYERRTFAGEGGVQADSAPRNTNLTWVHGSYFPTLGMRVLAGRPFTNVEDVEPRGVVIVNQRLAATVWPDQDPVGKRLRWGLDVPQNTNPWLTVVGVVADVTDGPFGTQPYLHAYEPFSQFPPQVWDSTASLFGRRLQLAVRTDSEPETLAPAVRSIITRLDSQLAVESIETMQQRVDQVVAPRRFSAATVGTFAGGALILAAIGLYGLLAFSVAERRREIAVRLALGANAAAILRMIGLQGLRLVGIGLAAGLAAAYAGSSAVAAFLYGTHRHDPATFLAVPLTLLLVALVACTVPAYRASRVNSSQVLKGD